MLVLILSQDALKQLATCIISDDREQLHISSHSLAPVKETIVILGVRTDLQTQSLTQLNQKLTKSMPIQKMLDTRAFTQGDKGCLLGK